MSLTTTLVNSAFKILTGLICRVDASQLSRVPAKGPLILVFNHINFLEVPMVYSRLEPRHVLGYARADLWDNSAFRFVLNLWKAIPVKRGEVDLQAIRNGVQALEDGKILGIAPEGTRSGTGNLGRGNPGVVMIALQGHAPLLPVIFYGHEQFKDNLRRLQRTNFHIRVGNPFTLNSSGARVSHQMREVMTDEIMYQMAACLPPENRGCYSDLSKATETYLEFFPPSASNLPNAESFL